MHTGLIMKKKGEDSTLPSRFHYMESPDGSEMEDSTMQKANIASMPYISL